MPPRVGHPAKEGLRQMALSAVTLDANAQSGSSSKRGIKTIILFVYHIEDMSPEWVIQQKRD